MGLRVPRGWLSAERRTRGDGAACTAWTCGAMAWGCVYELAVGAVRTARALGLCVKPECRAGV